MAAVNHNILLGPTKKVKNRLMAFLYANSQPFLN
jgi:hypothetical protein